MQKKNRKIAQTLPDVTVINIDFSLFHHENYFQFFSHHHCYCQHQTLQHSNSRLPHDTLKIHVCNSTIINTKCEFSIDYICLFGLSHAVINCAVPFTVLHHVNKRMNSVYKFSGDDTFWCLTPCLLNGQPFCKATNFIKFQIEFLFNAEFVSVSIENSEINIYPLINSNQKLCWLAKFIYYYYSCVHIYSACIRMLNLWKIQTNAHISIWFFIFFFTQLKNSLFFCQWNSSK